MRQLAAWQRHSFLAETSPFDSAVVELFSDGTVKKHKDLKAFLVQQYYKVNILVFEEA